MLLAALAFSAAMTTHAVTAPRAATLAPQRVLPSVSARFARARPTQQFRCQALLGPGTDEVLKSYAVTYYSPVGCTESRIPFGLAGFPYIVVPAPAGGVQGP